MKNAKGCFLISKRLAGRKQKAVSLISKQLDVLDVFLEQFHQLDFTKKFHKTNFRKTKNLTKPISQKNRTNFTN